MPDEKSKEQQRREAERATEETQRQAEKEQRERDRQGEQPTTKDAPPEDEKGKEPRQPATKDAPPEDEKKGTKDAPDKAPEPADYSPIKPKDDEENPVFVEVPKTDEDVAEEGTALAEAGSTQTGGNVPFLSTEPPQNKRIWSLDAAHNTNDRAGGRGAEHPDLVETSQ